MRSGDHMDGGGWALPALMMLLFVALADTSPQSPP
jgi:hypothetical protein